MEEKELKARAYEIAENTPKHLNKDTQPPIGWAVRGEELKVILADGRAVYGAITAAKSVISSPHVQANAVDPLPEKKISRRESDSK